MALFGLFGSKKKAKSVSLPGIHDPKWVRSKIGNFSKLQFIDTDDESLKGEAIYVVWHGGVRPQWLYVGATNNLGDAIEAVRNNDDITEYENRGGIFVTWAFIKKDYQPGAVAYLTSVMKPVVENRSAPEQGSVTPIQLYLPGCEPQKAGGNT